MGLVLTDTLRFFAGTALTVMETWSVKELVQETGLILEPLTVSVVLFDNTPEFSVMVEPLPSLDVPVAVAPSYNW